MFFDDIPAYFFVIDILLNFNTACYYKGTINNKLISNTHLFN